ncbi:hypothetical protein [uncultured Shewanella sp.]|uniref:hypothetical protein n=1 Tax=uncultured Shewanella sp. TaxID=173975 RepID=UPI002603B78C|nr:hypothetical protein [uncultured Shewanella sp.]
MKTYFEKILSELCENVGASISMDSEAIVIKSKCGMEINLEWSNKSQSMTLLSYFPSNEIEIENIESINLNRDIMGSAWVLSINGMTTLVATVMIEFVTYDNLNELIARFISLKKLILSSSEEGHDVKVEDNNRAMIKGKPLSFSFA